MAVAGASSPPGVINGVIHACIERGTVPDSPVGPDNLEFHLRNGKCPAGWTALSWNRRGPRGHKGHRGNVGRRGRTGRRGPHGPQGEVGAKGKIGATGATGPAGAAGANGTNGATGPAGPPGPTAAIGGGSNTAPPTPEGKVLETTQITTPSAGKIYAIVNANISCCASGAIAGLYVDGQPVPHSAVDCGEGCFPMPSVGVIANIPAGTHTVDFAVTGGPSLSSSQGSINAIFVGSS